MALMDKPSALNSWIMNTVSKVITPAPSDSPKPPVSLVGDVTFSKPPWPATRPPTGDFYFGTNGEY
jgi:hypothetical protein